MNKLRNTVLRSKSDTSGEWGSVGRRHCYTHIVRRDRGSMRDADAPPSIDISTYTNRRRIRQVQSYIFTSLTCVTLRGTSPLLGRDAIGIRT